MRKRIADQWYRFLRFTRSHRLETFIVGAIVLFLFLLFPTRFFTSINPGSVGVVWHRFAGGTDFCKVLSEGTHLKYPWDDVIPFDGRLQQREITFDTKTNNGLQVRLTLMYRYQLVVQNIPALYEYASADYARILLDPTVEVVARNVVSSRAPADIYAERPTIQRLIKEIASWDLFVRNDPTNIPRTRKSPDPMATDIYLERPIEPREDIRKAGSQATPAPDAQRPKTDFALLYPHLRKRDPDKPAIYFLPCSTKSPIDHFVWLNIESVLVKGIDFPPELQRSITENDRRQQELFAYYWKERIAKAEASRARVEAAGIRDASLIMSKGLTENYLRYVGIKATEELGTSPNTKTIVIGGGKDGLPLLLGSDSDTSRAATTANVRGNEIPTPMQFLNKQLAETPR